MYIPNKPEFEHDSIFYLQDLREYLTDDELKLFNLYDVRSLDDVYYLLLDHMQGFSLSLPTIYDDMHYAINTIFAGAPPYEIGKTLQKVDFTDSLLIEDPHDENKFGKFWSMRNRHDFYQMYFDKIIKTFKIANKLDLL